MIREPELIAELRKHHHELENLSQQAQDEAFWRIAHFIDAATRELAKIEPTKTKKELQARIKTCVNCKYVGVDPASEPCYGCHHQSEDKWEAQ